MKGKKIVVANWKMNPIRRDDAKVLFTAIKKIAQKLTNTAIVVCPPSIFLAELSGKKLPSACMVGAQDTFWEREGSFTGQLSPAMLAQYGCQYVIIGHSERRATGESDEMVNKKVVTAIKEGLTAVVCIGESERDKDGLFLEFLKSQINNSLKGISRKSLTQLVIAYEPIWAIGKSEAEAMDGERMHETSLYIKKILAESYGKEQAFRVPILYGGSVGLSNAAAIMSGGEIQGLLVGRQSLDSQGFGEMLMNIDKLVI